MGIHRKTVLKAFSYLRCDDFAAYLTQMAAKGWHFKEWGAGLVFEKGTPEKVQYAVEVFIDGSEYDTRPDVHTHEFAEYCKAAGWELIDAKRKFVIFKKVREDAVDILTPKERLETIAKEERKEIFQKMSLSYTWSILQLLRFNSSDFVNHIFSNGLLLISAAWISLAICATFRFIHYLVWKHISESKIDRGEDVFFGGRKNLFAFTGGWYSWLTTAVGIVVLTGLSVTCQIGTLIIVISTIAVFVVMGYLIARFRPDSETNQIIQIIVSILLVTSLLTGAVVIFFTQDSWHGDPAEVPLYYADIGGEAGEITDIFVDRSTSIFGSALRCRVTYEEENIGYSVYLSDHPWVIDTIWEDEMDRKYNQTGEFVTELWGAVEARRNAAGEYLVKYADAIVIIGFADDSILTAEDVAVIRAALLERR